MTDCKARSQSQAVPGHTHTCMGNHAQRYLYHYCAECRRWWGKR